jgi:hypothetical protein
MRGRERAGRALGHQDERAGRRGTHAREREATRRATLAAGRPPRMQHAPGVSKSE